MRTIYNHRAHPSVEVQSLCLNSVKNQGAYLDSEHWRRWWHQLSLCNNSMAGLFKAWLMTDYYGAFSTSTSNFPGQIQSATIDTSYKSIVTCLYNNKKIEKIIWLKCSPVSAPPPTPLMGLSYGEQSLCRVPPARGSSNALSLQFLYIWGKKPRLLPCGSISLTLTRRSLALVPSLFSFLCCCKFTLFVSKLGKRVELVLFLILIHLKLFTAWIFWKPLI